MRQVGLIGILVTGTFWATLAPAQGSYSEGRVVSAIPIYETVRVPSQREVCWDEEVRYRRGKSHTPALVGGAIGGAVGRQFGGGRGKDALTVVGALLGASIGNDVERKRHQRDEEVRIETRCRVADEYHDEERISGYHVRYEYAGRTYTTRTERDPGEWIKLRVAVTPVSY